MSTTNPPSGSSTSNLVKILVANSTGIASDTLYLYVTDGLNNFYAVTQANGWTATVNSAGACCIALSALPNDASGCSYFYMNSENSITGGRLWFADSDTALSVASSGGIVQPTVTAGFVFDFVELAVTGGTTSAPGSANIDTTQVDALGIPITLYVNPASNGLTFPPSGAAPASYFPNIIGIQPGLSLETIIANFTNGVTGTAYAPFSACAWSSGGVNRLVAPFHVIPNYSGTAGSGLASFLDQAIFQFFQYYQNNTLLLQDPVSLHTYSGQTTTVTATDTTGNTSTYNVLQFTNSTTGDTCNVYYPYFTTNCAAWPGALAAGVTLSPPPSWWTSNLPTTAPATAQLLACNGVFSDSAFQTGASNPTLLGNLENQVASLLNRGLTPVTNNLIELVAGYSATDIQNNQVNLTSGLPAGATFATGMNLVKQISAQPTQVVAVSTIGGNAAQIILTDPVGALLPVQSCRFQGGTFYATTQANAAGYSNAYSGYLHNGLGGSTAPLLNNIGYGFAYDDQGGYSNDITVGFDNNNAMTLGIYLGPLTNS